VSRDLYVRHVNSARHETCVLLRAALEMWGWRV